MKRDDLEQVDYLIIGQGLAGTMVAHFLLLENKKIKVIDRTLPGATTLIAAGVINPVTGRRIAKSWRFEELYDFAKKTYRQIEAMLGINIWTDTGIVRALHNAFEENEWDRRGAFPEYEGYFADRAGMDSFTGKLKPAHAWGELRQCAQVALPSLIKSYRQKFIKEGLFLEEIFDYRALTLLPGKVAYKNIQASKAIFCEGAKATKNPYFNHLPFVPTKGELLVIHIPGANFDKILKHHLFIVPFNDNEIEASSWRAKEYRENLYWAGSTSRFEFGDEHPTATQKQDLVEKLEKTLNVPFEIIAHHAGIRPTVQDVRPFLGLHREHEQLGIFNGLGTKGASLAPFFAHQLAAYLSGRGQLDREVDIQRFSKKAG